MIGCKKKVSYPFVSFAQSFGLVFLNSNHNGLKSFPKEFSKGIFSIKKISIAQGTSGLRTKTQNYQLCWTASAISTHEHIFIS